MIIKSVTIKNFRCIKDLNSDIAELTAFIGRNGSGKSTLLQALNIFYDIKAPVSEEDFFNGNTDSPIEITVEFRGLSEQEKEEFARYFDGNGFAVTKVIDYGDGKPSQRYYAATRQIPAISRIRNERTTTDKRNAWNQLIDNGELPGAESKSVRGDNPDELMDAYEAAHPEFMAWVQEEVQFLGPPNIGGGKLDKYTKFVYVPAVRDASDDTTERKGSPLSQLLDFVVMRRFHSRDEVRQLKEEFTQKLTDLYDAAKLTEFSELASEISNTLHLYVPNAQLDLVVREPRLPEIPNPTTIANLIEDEYTGSIDRKGHGLQRALIFSLLQHLAVTQSVEDSPETLKEEKATDESLDQEVGATSGPSLIIAIEEPELYQHPLRARHLARTLLTMSRESSLGPGGQNQILYCTHSTYFVDLQRFDQLRIMRKTKRDPSEPPCTKMSRFTLGQASERMAQLTGQPKENFTPQSFRARAYPVMTQSVNEGFFADAVVLVEGNTEAAALLALSNRLGHDWLSQGIAVVSVEGKTKIDRAAVVFNGFEIPTYIVFDGDIKHKGTRVESNEAASNRLLLKLCGVQEEDFPDSVATTNYACFADDFEAYCRETIGQEIYRRLMEQTTQEHGYTRPSQGIKNFEVVEDLVGRIYDNGYTLPLLEDMINRINARLTTPRLVDKNFIVNDPEKVDV